MAAPSLDHLPSMESLRLSAQNDRLLRWCSSSSTSASSSSTSASRSTSCTSYTDCPTMSKSLTDSLSSDTQTENETPPESPGENEPDVQITPLLHAPSPRRKIGYPRRPPIGAVTSHLSIYSEPGCDSDGSDAGYETESEDKYTRRIRGKGKRSAFRVRGALPHRPTNVVHNRFLSGTRIPTTSQLATSTRPPSPTSGSPTARRSSLSRPGGPTKISLPQPFPPTFPKSGKKGPIGLGLGLGLPSTLSDVRRAPNCAHRSNTDPIVSPSRSIFPVAPCHLLKPLAVDPFPPVPPKPRLNPKLSPHASDTVSPLDLPSPLLLDDELSPPGAPIQSRHASFCFAHGTRSQMDFDSSASRMTAGAFLAIAEYAQLQRPAHALGISQGPPSRGSQLQSTPEEVCEGDEARGISRFQATNPYFAAVGYCVTSG